MELWILSVPKAGQGSRALPEPSRAHRRGCDLFAIGIGVSMVHEVLFGVRGIQGVASTTIDAVQGSLFWRRDPDRIGGRVGARWSYRHYCKVS